MASLFVRGCRYIHRHARQILYANRYYNWYVFSRRLSKRWYDILQQHYSGSTSGRVISEKKTVVFLCNGLIDHGGWADRLKGILSTYALCKDLNLDFRISFISPFVLSDYLVPNSYDWTIRDEDVIYDRSVSDIVTLEIGQETAWQAKKQYQLLKKKIMQSSARQIHVYTNAHFAYRMNFSVLFDELFRPSEKLQFSLNHCKHELGQNYISVSSRFIYSLGDFVDTQQGEPLPEPLRQQLLDKCVAQVRQLHDRHPESRILVCSDSPTFLRTVAPLPYTYIYSGRMVHFDVPDGQSNYELYEKTFVDFLLIANASHICRLETRWIRKSGFPYAASRVYGHPFHSIRF